MAGRAPHCAMSVASSGGDEGGGDGRLALVAA